MRDDNAEAGDLLSIRQVVFALKVFFVCLVFFVLRVAKRRRGERREETPAFPSFPPKIKFKKSVFACEDAETRRPGDGVLNRFPHRDPSAQTGTPALHGLPHVHAVQTFGYPTSFIPLASIVWYTSARTFGFFRGTPHEHVLCQFGTGGAVHGGAHHDDAEFLRPSGQFLPATGAPGSAPERRRSRSEEAGEPALRGAAQPGQGLRSAQLLGNFSDDIR